MQEVAVDTAPVRCLNVTGASARREFTLHKGKHCYHYCITHAQYLPCRSFAPGRIRQGVRLCRKCMYTQYQKKPKDTNFYFRISQNLNARNLDFYRRHRPRFDKPPWISPKKCKDIIETQFHSVSSMSGKILLPHQMSICARDPDKPFDVENNCWLLSTTELRRLRRPRVAE